MKLHSDFDCLKYLRLVVRDFEFTKSFSKEYKYTVGDRLKKQK
jgi:hypothetical protein